MNIIPSSREDWEALSAEDLKGFSDQQLKTALRDHFGLRSHIYFMPVAKKRQFIIDEEARPTIQAEAEERQRGHADRGAEHRGKASIATLTEERSDGMSFTFVGVDRPKAGFTDPFNDRTGKVAYVIQDNADGQQYPVQKQTARRLEDLGRLDGFDERVSAAKQKPAHKSGSSTLEDVIAAGDPAVQAVAEKITSGKKPVSAGDLDDILNSIPS